MTKTRASYARPRGLLQIDLVERHVPVRVENLEAPLLFF